MPTYQETIAGYTAADWDAVITLHRNDIQRLQDRYGTQANIAWVGEEIGYLQLKIKQAEQRKAGLANGDDNANI
jgi:hypothetical protein